MNIINVNNTMNNNDTGEKIQLSNVIFFCNSPCLSKMFMIHQTTITSMTQ
jgi:hypothetical protein